MIKHSQQSKGFMPTKSGPNLSGFYMGNSSNLMQMYQTGGDIPSAYKKSFSLTATPGGATLARAIQRRSDADTLEDYQRKEAERQKRGGLFGSIAGTGLALIGGAIAGPAGAGIGKAIGTGLGQRFGAGKAVDYDSSGTVFAQQAFRDVDEASEDFNQGILGRSLLEGAKTGLTAGLTPGGGVYGAYNPLKSAGRANISKMVSGVGLKGFTGGQGLLGFSQPEFVQATSAMPQTLSQSEIASRAMDYSQRYGDQASQLFMDDFGIQIPGAQTGGLIEYQYGGGVGDIQQILQDAGIQANENQLALFEQFDPSSLNELASDLQSSLLSGTKQVQAQQAGTGFSGSGVTQEAQKEQREIAMGQLESAQEKAARGFESQTLGDAASMINEGVDFGRVNNEPQFEQAPTQEAGWSPPESPQQGATYAFNNKNWVWDGSNWVTGAQFTYDMDSYYDDMYG